MMSPILRLDAEISCMLATACCTTAPPRVAMPEAEGPRMTILSLKTSMDTLPFMTSWKE